MVQDHVYICTATSADAHDVGRTAGIATTPVSRAGEPAGSVHQECRASGAISRRDESGGKRYWRRDSQDETGTGSGFITVEQHCLRVALAVALALALTLALTLTFAVPSTRGPSAEHRQSAQHPQPQPLDLELHQFHRRR